MSIKLDEFTKAYLGCALGTSTGDDDEYLDMSLTIYDINASHLEEVKVECLNFQRDNVELLNSAYQTIGYGPGSAGHDLWLTRNGHGAGFWDRNLGEVGDKLTAKCDELKASDLYQGDDKQLYFTNLPKDRKLPKPV